MRAVSFRPPTVFRPKESYVYKESSSECGVHIGLHLMHLPSFVCFMDFIYVYCKHLPTVSGTRISSGLAADIKGMQQFRRGRHGKKRNLQMR